MPALTGRHRSEAADEPGVLKRRGLLAAAAAFVAGAIAKLSEQPVYAGADGDVVLGTINNAATTTVINSTATDGHAFQAIGSGAGFGVWGTSPNGYPIFGQVAGGSSANTIAIYGANASSFTGGTPGAGGFGIYGISALGHGLVGATGTAGGAAIVGATNGIAGAYAAAFYGPVAVTGSLTVFGAKSAAVPHPDGSHRRLYCVESPECWFEDFGIGSLECGRAEITIDPDFAALVDLSDYHVFLTERDTHQHLIVRDRTPTGFRVEADAQMAALMGKREGELSGDFSWRIVAKRRDIPGPRLETVSIPSEPALPSIPDLTGRGFAQ